MSEDEKQSRVHRWALLLTAALVAVFVAATALYARYGYAVVLKTFEANQMARAEAATGSRVAREYEDYLRVDPSSLMVRGLLINRLLEERRGAEAVEVAQRGVEIASAEDKPIAELLVARAKMGNGDLDGAEKIYSDVLTEHGDSGEAHYGLALIHSAQGLFSQSYKDFQNHWETWFDTIPSFSLFGLKWDPKARIDRMSRCSPDFQRRVLDAFENVSRLHVKVSMIQRNSAAIPADVKIHVESPGFSYLEFGVSSLLLGNIDFAFAAFREAKEEAEKSATALYWQGAHEETLGNLDEAQRFYRMAAEQRDPLAIAALERLGREGE